jgi:lipopolysaccharide transport system ATP-binding protein
MEDVAKGGRTVLLVSHSVSTIVAFCDRCILLDQGRLLRDGDAADVTEFYQESVTANSDKTPDVIRAEAAKTNKARFTAIRLTPLGEDGTPKTVARVGHDMEIEVTVHASERISDANVAIAVFDVSGYRLIDANIALKNDYLTLDAGQEAVVRFTLRTILLRPDSYRIALWLGRRPVEDIDIVANAATFTIEVDPRRIKHFQVYPAVYQCEFTHSKLIREAHGDSVPLESRA